MTEADNMLWFSTGSGRIELCMTLDDARTAHHQGRCDDDVQAMMRVPYIARQLEAIPDELLAAELREWGAWDDEELADHDANLARILWLAAGNIVDDAIMDNAP